MWCGGVSLQFARGQVTNHLIDVPGSFLDLAYQPSINANQVKELMAVRRIASGENLILLGRLGVAWGEPT